MKKVFEKVVSCEDMQELKACLQIMIESCEIGMNNSAMLEMMKQIQGEVSGCNYDEEMADMHLCLIGQLHNKRRSQGLLARSEKRQNQYSRLVCAMGRDG